MSHTAFSQHFTQELDFKQLLKRRGVTASLDQTDYGLSPAERDWMRSDLLCPSCRCGGASLVRSDTQGGGGNTRQAHFRFLDAAGYAAHKLGCDFFAMDDAPGIQKGVDVQFSANDKDTKVVRGLVCKAISIGAISKTAIYEMRSWFLDQRAAGTFVVKGTPAMADWLWSLTRLQVYGELQFQPFHVTLPGFETRRAARRDLAYHYREFLKQMPRVRFDAAVCERTKRILTASQGQTLIVMEPLRPKLEMTIRLAGVMAEYGDLPLTKRRQLGSFYGDTPEALLAFTSALLFVSGWDEVAALARFATILAAPTPDDLTLGNVMGLNPFHDFAALELARFIAGLTPASERAYDLDAELNATITMIEATV
ncbi:MAG: hypothetical protein JWM33_759 [Caulobacteraceae bacterium]|nr:hypothetical protein [Caulobacteraceae bacterium]